MDRHTREGVIVSIQEAADEMGEPLSADDYREWTSGRIGLPSLDTVCYAASGRFEDWHDACDAAGVEVP